MEENKIETPLSEVDSNVNAEETLSTNTADSDVEEVQEFDPEVESKASAFTPVPGGVGVVCNMMLMDTLTRHI